MIVADSSIRIDYFAGQRSHRTERLTDLIARQEVHVGDIILMEVLRGFRHDPDFHRARDLMLSLPQLDMLGTEDALQAADNYRTLRKRGITIRKTADAIIASFCIAHDHELLFSDRDFVPFVEHLGLRSATRA